MADALTITNESTKYIQCIIHMLPFKGTLHCCFQPQSISHPNHCHSKIYYLYRDCLSHFLVGSPRGQLFVPGLALILTVLSCEPMIRESTASKLKVSEMVPVAGIAAVKSRTTGAAKPQSSNGLVLEAWAQGYLVGSLIIMAAITVANMRKSVLLHKLILLEVCPVQMTILSTTELTMDSIAVLRSVASYLHLCESPCLWVVSELDRYTTQYIVVFAQCYCLAKDEAVLVQELEYLLHRHSHHSPTVLDPGDLCELHLFRIRHQQLVRDNTPL
jgi:hypothetical protein